MSEKINLIHQETLYQGYNQLVKYNLEVPSLGPKKSHHALHRELLCTSNSVHILLYASEIDSFVLCKEFRAGVFFNADKEDPFILECVSGTVDKDDEPEEAAFREVQEETGLVIQQLKKVITAYKSPGLMTEKTFIFYSETKEIPKNKLHGTEDEEIATCIVPRQEVYCLMDELKIVDSATLLALYWFRCQSY